MKSSVTDTNGADTIEVSISNLFIKYGTNAPINAPNTIFNKTAIETNNAIE